MSANAVVDVNDLPSRWAEIVALAEAGGDVVVTEANVPRARLVSYAASKERVPGLHLGAIEASDDFGAELPEEFWTGETGKP